MSDPTWFLVEDGSSLPNSNSYVTFAYADSYHEMMGNSYWNLLDTTVKYNCLVRATAFIDKRFTSKFRGFRMQRDQALAWPRLAAFDDDKYAYTGIPIQLQRATVEYALRAAIYNVLAPDVQRPVASQDMGSEDPNSALAAGIIAGPVRLVTSKVGTLEQMTAYDTPAQFRRNSSTENSRAPQSNVVNDIFIPQYPEAELLLEILLNNEGSVGLVRS